jgi:hypothetical protein
MSQAVHSGDFRFIIEERKVEKPQKAGLADLKTHHLKENCI